LTHKIRAGAIPQQSSKIPPPIPREQPLRFSFKHVDLTRTGKFCSILCEDGYLNKFLERLRDCSALTVGEFRSNRSSALRAHRIDFDETTEKAGFTNLNTQMQENEAWQFSLTSNAHGRIHGILLSDTFYVIWIDPKHKLYD
jgi:hypothetical protein